MECSCNRCQQACKRKPGVFIPGEVAAAAALLGLSEADFFRKHLLVEYQLPSEENGRKVPLFMLAPATASSLPGMEAPFDPRGRCVFFDAEHGRCRIHAAKPAECREWDHTMTFEQQEAMRSRLFATWDNPEAQAWIAALLGHQPVAAEPTSMADVIGLLYG